MTKQEQVKEILEVIKHCGDYTNRDCAECDYRLYGECKNQKQCEAEALYNEGYRKVPFGATVLAPEERNDEIREMHEILEGRDELIAKVGILGRENYDLKAENEQLKAKLEARLTCDFVEARQNYAVQDFAEREVKKARKETAKEIMQCLYDKCYEIQNLRECVAHITPLDILQLAKHYGVEVEE